METNPDSLVEKIQTAEKALSARLRELEAKPESTEEKVALHDAVSTLRALKSALTQSEGQEN
jgi:spore germination cell wall hydrolase CwlJ-like protein